MLYKMCEKKLEGDTYTLFNVVLILVHRLRRWTNIKPTISQHRKRQLNINNGIQ